MKEDKNQSKTRNQKYGFCGVCFLFRWASMTICHTVDGRNPANHPGCMKPWKSWHKLCQPQLVQDFFQQQYHHMISYFFVTWQVVCSDPQAQWPQWVLTCVLTKQPVGLGCCFCLPSMYRNHTQTKIPEFPKPSHKPTCISQRLKIIYHAPKPVGLPSLNPFSGSQKLTPVSTEPFKAPKTGRSRYNQVYIYIYIYPIGSMYDTYNLA